MSESEGDDREPTAEELELLAEAERVASKKSGKRASQLCAEPMNTDPSWKVPVYEKTTSQRDVISNAVSSSILFSSLTPDVRETVMHAFRGPLKYEKGAFVILEGEQVAAADHGLFVLERGHLDACKSPPGCPEIRPGAAVFHYDKPGQVFGELALLYDCPRQATVVVTEEATLWSLDRHTFNQLVKGSHMEARKKMHEFLSTVDLLKSLTNDDRDKLIDTIERRTVTPGDFIIRRGDTGTEVFILIDGVACAFAGDLIVKEYVPGSYFGELALLQGRPRAVDVLADPSKGATIAVLNADAFRRLLGPLQEEMETRAKAYTALPSNAQSPSSSVGAPLLGGGQASPSKASQVPGGWGCCACSISTTKEQM